MDYKYIEQLLDRYFLCETSLEEESILRTFFGQSDVPASLLQYKELFLAQKVSEERLSNDFDERIMSMIANDVKAVDNNVKAIDDDAQTVSSEEQQNAIPVVKAKELHLSYQLRPFFRAAAVVAVILSFSLAVQQAMYSSQDQNGTVYGSASPGVVSNQPETALDQHGIVARPDSLAQLSSEVPSASELVPER